MKVNVGGKVKDRRHTNTERCSKLRSKLRLKMKRCCKQKNTFIITR